MNCEHDLSDRETACADGMCPLCLAARRAEAEAGAGFNAAQLVEIVHLQARLAEVERQRDQYSNELTGKALPRLAEAERIIQMVYDQIADTFTARPEYPELVKAVEAYLQVDEDGNPVTPDQPTDRESP